MHDVHPGTLCTRIVHARVLCPRIVHTRRARVHARGVTVSAWTASGGKRPQKQPLTAAERVQKRIAWWDRELETAYDEGGFTDKAPDELARAALGVLWRWLVSESRQGRTGHAQRIADHLLAEIAQHMETACRMLANMDPVTGQPVIPPDAREAS